MSSHWQPDGALHFQSLLANQQDFGFSIGGRRYAGNNPADLGILFFYSLSQEEEHFLVKIAKVFVDKTNYSVSLRQY